MLLGASGAGKSTLTNVLLGDEAMETGEVGRTGEGRHTTTRRELLPLPAAGRSSTPRGSGPPPCGTTTRRRTSPVAVPRLDELAEECRFSDCAHDGRRGAPWQAVADGDLDRGGSRAYLAYLTDQAGGRGPGGRRPARPPGPQPPSPALSGSAPRAALLLGASANAPTVSTRPCVRWLKREHQVTLLRLSAPRGDAWPGASMICSGSTAPFLTGVECVPPERRGATVPGW